jgi:hypothetical protein
MAWGSYLAFLGSIEVLKFSLFSSSSIRLQIRTLLSAVQLTCLMVGLDTLGAVRNEVKKVLR